MKRNPYGENLETTIVSFFRLGRLQKFDVHAERWEAFRFVFDLASQQRLEPPPQAPELL